jgi:hypothetical protein
MSATQSIIWGFPTKGLDTNQARRNQPKDTTPDSLNVLPYEPISGRLRGGSRPGTKKVYAGALAAYPIQHLSQCTIALDPATVTISGTNQITGNSGADSTFAYSNGDLASAGTAHNYRTSGNNGPTVSESGVYSSSSTGRVSVSSGACAFVAARSAAAIYTPALGLSSAYVLRLTATLQSSPATINAAYGVRLLARVNTSTYNDGLEVWCSVNLKAISIWQGSPGFYASNYWKAEYEFPTPLAAGTYTIDFRVNGNVFKVFVNGVDYLTAVVTTGAGNSGVGFGAFPTNTATDTIDDFQVYAGVGLSSYRQTNIVAVCNGGVYIGNTTALTLANGGTNALSSQLTPQIAYFPPKGYAVDGFAIQQINLTTATVETYTATAGTAPANCTLACSWNGRLVLAGKRDDPSQWYMSAQLAPTDWNYGGGLSTSAVAATTNPSMGQVGDAIIAMIPFTDDILVFLCDHTLVVLNGDPGTGGHLDLVSNAIGGLGPNCWTKSPEGILYFAGTSGFYEMQPGGGAPKCISNTTINEFFRAINRSTTYVQCQWDRDRWGCWIFCTPIVSGTATHLFYDVRSGGFWKMRFPNDYGPISALVYDGDAATDRLLLMGGRTGYIYQFDDTLAHDDGPTAITSYVWLGPFIAEDDLHETKVYSLQAYLSDQQGSLVNQLDWTLQGGSDAMNALSASPDATASGSYAAAYGRQPSNNEARLRGLCFAMKCGGFNVGTAVTIAGGGMVRTSTTTVVTAALHPFFVGDMVRISGCSDATFNADFVITARDAGTFTFVQPGQADSTPATPGSYALLPRRFSFERMLLPITAGAQIRT